MRNMGSCTTYQGINQNFNPSFMVKLKVVDFQFFLKTILFIHSVIPRVNVPKI